MKTEKTVNSNPLEIEDLWHRQVYCNRRQDGLFHVRIDGTEFFMDPCHPGYCHLDKGTYNIEIRSFIDVLNHMDGTKAPVMVELGSNWALWSIIFKNRFPDATNILVELFRTELLVGIRNFHLNGLDCIPYHGGCNLDLSETMINYAAKKPSGEVGQECDFLSIWDNHQLPYLDLLHMDIQGSEFGFLSTYERLIASHRISNLVIATHDHLFDHSIHEPVRDILLTNGYVIGEDIPPDTDDGYIWAHIPKKSE